MALLRMSLVKLVRRPATWVVFAILAGIIALVFISLGATAWSMESMASSSPTMVDAPKRATGRHLTAYRRWCGPLMSACRS